MRYCPPRQYNESINKPGAPYPPPRIGGPAFLFVSGRSYGARRFLCGLCPRVLLVHKNHDTFLRELPAGGPGPIGPVLSWKGYSPKFALTEFSEVRTEYLRLASCTLRAQA